MKLEIETLTDECECEICGYHWAEGAIVKLDGNVFLEAIPSADCCGCSSWSSSGILVMVLHKLGYKVYIDGDLAHITSYHESYHGSSE